MIILYEGAPWNLPLHLHAMEPGNLRVTIDVPSGLCQWSPRVDVETSIRLRRAYVVP